MRYPVLDPRQPVAGPTPVMGNGQYLDYPRTVPIEYGVGELHHANASNVWLSFNAIPLWRFTNYGHHSFEFDEIQRAEAGSF